MNATPLLEYTATGAPLLEVMTVEKLARPFVVFVRFHELELTTSPLNGAVNVKLDDVVMPLVACKSGALTVPLAPIGPSVVIFALVISNRNGSVQLIALDVPAA